MIPNWEKFQHRSDRSLPWIKLYTELSGRDDWRSLTLSERGLLVCIWIEYQRSKGQLRVADLPSRVGQKVRGMSPTRPSGDTHGDPHATPTRPSGDPHAPHRRPLDSLRGAGFLVFSDTQPLPLKGGLDVEKRRTPPTPPQGEPVDNSKNGKPKAKTTGWRYVRGTHGHTYIPDPTGVDLPPKGYA